MRAPADDADLTTVADRSAAHRAAWDDAWGVVEMDGCGAAEAGSSEAGAEIHRQGRCAIAGRGRNEEFTLPSAARRARREWFEQARLNREISV